jgi:hypothetical protein
VWLGYTVGSSFLAGVGSNSALKVRKMTAPPLENMVLLFVGVFIIYKIYENMTINV